MSAGAPAPSPGPDGFAAHVGVEVQRHEAAPGGCVATAVLEAPPPWLAASGPAEARAVPTGALLALVDATARAAADAVLASPGVRATLVPAATSVQYGPAAAAPLTASASVPCEGVLTDRADGDGRIRFSVAVEVTDAGGERVATASVQWRATLIRDRGA
ncbi:MAG TPA: hypothetical protein VFZ77_16110 [Acidimicrobiales bacterium]